MKILVVYKSKTGFTKKYAEMIAKAVAGDILDFKDTTADKMSSYDVIVYGGGLYAGMINGWKKARDMFAKSTAKQFIVYATGGTPNEVTDKIEEVWNTNFSAEELKSIPHFYMQGGICYEQMSFFNKKLMKMMANVLSKQQEKDGTRSDFGHSLKESYDISSEEYIEPLVRFVLEGRDDYE